MNDSKNFFKDKQVLITGGAGFIGKTREEFGCLFQGFSFVWKDRGDDHSIVAISRE